MTNTATPMVIPARPDWMTASDYQSVTDHIREYEAKHPEEWAQVVTEWEEQVGLYPLIDLLATFSPGWGPAPDVLREFLPDSGGDAQWYGAGTMEEVARDWLDGIMEDATIDDFLRSLLWWLAVDDTNAMPGNPTNSIIYRTMGEEGWIFLRDEAEFGPDVTYTQWYAFRCHGWT